MKKYYYSLIVIVMLFSCSKPDSDSPTPPTEDNYVAPYTIKYEIVFSGPVENMSNIYIHYNDDTHQYPIAKFEGLNSSNYQNQKWSHTFTTNLNVNPYIVDITTNATLITSGTVTFNVYANGTLYHTSTMNRGNIASMGTNPFDIGTFVYIY